MTTMDERKIKIKKVLYFNRDHGYNATSLTTKLRHYHFKEHKTYSLDVSNIPLTAKVQLPPQIHALNLSSTHFPSSHLASYLHHNPSLVYLNITGNHYTEQQKLLLSDALWHSNLKYFITDRFWIDNTTNSHDILDELLPEDSALFFALCRHRPSIRLHQSVRGAGSGMLSRLLESSRCTLTSLHLSQAWIGNKGAVLLSEGLRNNGTLTVLDLSGKNGISHQGMVALSQALSSGPRTPTFVLSFSKWASSHWKSPTTGDHVNLYLAALGKSYRVLSLLDVPAARLGVAESTLPLLVSLLQQKTVLHLRFRHASKSGCHMDMDMEMDHQHKQELTKSLDRSRVERLEVHGSRLFGSLNGCFETHPVLDVSREVEQLLNALPLPTDVIGIVKGFARIVRVVVERGVGEGRRGDEKERSEEVARGKKRGSCRK